jgi:hypothetical protein
MPVGSPALKAIQLVNVLALTANLNISCKYHSDYSKVLHKMTAFQCEECFQHVRPIVAQYEKNYPRSVRFTFRWNPLIRYFHVLVEIIKHVHYKNMRPVELVSIGLFTCSLCLLQQSTGAM